MTSQPGTDRDLPEEGPVDTEVNRPLNVVDMLNAAIQGLIRAVHSELPELGASPSAERLTHACLEAKGAQAAAQNVSIHNA